MVRRYILPLALLFLTGTLFAAGTGGGAGGGSGAGSSMRASGAAMQPGTSALDWYNAGYAASNAGNYSQAIADFTKAINLKSDYAEAYNMLGFDTRKSGDVAKAFTYYQTALKLRPDFPEAREYYGEAFLQEGDLVHAVQQYVILEKARTRNAGDLLAKIELFVDGK